MALLKPFSDSKGRIAFDLVRKEIKQVEKQISQQVNAFDPEVAPYIDYICNTSGKRIRPALAVLAGGALGKISDDNLKIGVIFELIHMATLVHDDIIDEADTRRKTPTPNAKWGNGMAVLLGDALFSHALLLATEFGCIDICRKVGTASREVCQGEVIQTQRRFDLSLTKEEYFQVIAMKTGALFAASAGISASLSGANSDTEQKIYDYGLKLGTAFQIYDDCLDLVGSEDTVGKTLRTDLEKGKLTLPLLNLLETAPNSTKKQLQKSIKDKEPLDFEGLVGKEAYAEAVDDSLNTAAQMLQEARSNLDCLQPNDYTTGLLEITKYLEDLIDKCRR
ncbi:polyprenyl synthetase family protein [Rubritalea tangerina]|uniref:Polyprenyl synthetase family protein n=2 Tax=Rubritalea tangerina TaxID=430798 RepID=A0ABW4Z707_9BACT